VVERRTSGFGHCPREALVQELLDLVTDLGDEVIPIVEGQARRRHGLPDAHADVDRPDERAALPHRITAALDRHRNDGRLRFDGHDESPLLEREQRPAAASGAFGEDEKRIALAK
jgi:hypothetical protein